MSQRTVTVVTANVQRLFNDRKRLTLFSRWAKVSNADLFLLSEIGTPTLRDCQRWQEDCLNLALKAIFVPNCQAGIVWRPGSPVFNGKAPHSLYEISKDLFQPERSIDAVFQIGSEEVRIISVYVPVYPDQKVPYLKGIKANLSHKLRRESVIMAGDWNCVPNPLLDSQVPTSNNIGGEELRQFTAEAALCDGYRHLYPRKKIFSNKSNGSDRRLDQIYISQKMKGGINSLYHWNAYMSTHEPVVMRWIVPGMLPIGPSWFKLGDHIANDPDLQNYLEDTTRQYHELATRLDTTGNPQTIWNTAKTYLVPKLADIARVKRAFNMGSDGLDELDHRSRCVRARLPPNLAGKLSVHIRLRQVREADLLPALKTSNGQLVETTEGMLEEARSFFGNLYAIEPTDPRSRTDLLSYITKKVSQESKENLSRPFCRGELGEALAKCNKKSSPGPDGLPFSFYEATWKVTGPILKKIINFWRQNGEGSATHMTHITLLHKKGDKDQLSNKRPISLINCDERIVDQAINLRLKNVLPEILHESQTGFVPGRQIGSNIQTVLNAVDDRHLYPGHLACLDFEKAYDRVDRTYLRDTLKAFDFPNSFQNLIMATISNTQAKIAINGWLSAPIDVERGVRQGSPLAPSLFILGMEALGQLLRRKIHGIRHIGLPPFQEDIPHLQSLMFADDVLIGLKDQADLVKAEQALQLFQSASGGKLNQSKSFLYGLDRQPSDLRSTWQWSSRNAPFRYLGVMVGSDLDVNQVWSDLIAKVRKRMDSIPMFDLPLVTKCSVINIYCFSKILFVDQFIPASVENLKTIQKAAIQAIWGKKKHTVNEALLQSPLDHGGFGLIPLQLHLDCGRAQWIVRLLSAEWQKDRYLGAVRRKLCQTIEEQIRFGAAHHDQVMSCTWLDPNTLEQKFSRYSWVALFLHVGGHGNPMKKWERARETLTSRGLVKRWQEYLWSWEWLVDISQESARQWNRYLGRQYWIFNCDGPLEDVFLKCDPEHELGVKAISKAQATVIRRLRPPIVPAWDGSIFRNPARWKLWYQTLKKVRSRLPDYEESLHLFSLGKLHSPARWIRQEQDQDERWPHNTSRFCCLCSQDIDETQEHVLYDCQVAKDLWKFLLPPDPQPVNPSQLLQLDQISPMVLGYAACYTGMIFKLIFQRRLFRTTPHLEPINYDKMRAEATRLDRIIITLPEEFY